jgi:hypothetical protein
MRDVFVQELLVLLFRLVDGIDLGRPLFKIDLVPFPNAKLVRIYFHLHPFGGEPRSSFLFGA